METQINAQEIMNKLMQLQDDVTFLRQNMEHFDDFFLSEDDTIALDESLINEKEGKLASFEDIENARNKI